jgi:hypothetical protein
LQLLVSSATQNECSAQSKKYRVSEKISNLAAPRIVCHSK